MVAGLDRVPGFQGFVRESAFPLRELPPAAGQWSVGGHAENARSYAPAYFDGSFTVRRRRPFLRRRLSTSRPHFVDMRKRNPCLRILFLFRGLYVGFPIPAPDSHKHVASKGAKPIPLFDIDQAKPRLLAFASVDLSTSPSYVRSPFLTAPIDTFRC